MSTAVSTGATEQRGMLSIEIGSGTPMRLWDPSADGIAVAAILVGLLLRAQGLWRYVLEQDELYTLQEATELWNTTLLPGIQARPLYYLLQHVLLDILPQGPVFLRVAPFAFGMAGLWLTWRLARSLFGPAAGAAAAVFISLSPWHIYASGMARYWSLLYLAAVAYFALLKTAFGTDLRRHHLAASVLLMAGTATHPTFLFAMVGVVAGMHLISVSGHPGLKLPSRNFMLYQAAPYVIFLLLAVSVLVFTGSQDAVRNWSGRGPLATLRLVPAIVDWCTVTLCVAAVIGAVTAAYRGSLSQRRWGVAMLLGVVGTLLLLLSASFVTDTYADYAFPAFPLVILGAAALVGRLADASRSSTLPAAAATAVIAAGMLPTMASHLSDGTRFDYRPIYRHIEATAADPLVLTWPVNIQRRYAPGLRGELIPMRPAELERRLVSNGDLWVVASVRRFGMVTDDDGAVMHWLLRNCTLSDAFERTRFDYRRYRVEAHRCRRP